MLAKSKLLFVFGLLIIFISFSIKAQIPETSTTVQGGSWVKTIKYSGLEKYLFYNIEGKKQGNNLVINLDVNVTVYNFLKNAYENPTLEKCFIIQDYISDDYPNFDCNNPSHRQIIQDRLTDYIENGWKLFHNGIDKGYIDVNKNHVTITIPNIQNRDRIKLGQYTLIFEYQDINLINYNTEWFDLNSTLFIYLDNQWNNTVNNIWVQHNSDKDKFGANVYNFNTPQYFKYLIKSTEPIRDKGSLLYSIEKKTPKQCGSIPCFNIESHNIDFFDICTGGNETFNPECEFNLINPYTLEVKFNATYDSDLGYIPIDPAISISSSNFIYGKFINTTGEPQFSHLKVNDDNVKLYIDFEYNFTAGAEEEVMDMSPLSNDDQYRVNSFQNTTNDGPNAYYATFDGKWDTVMPDMTDVDMGLGNNFGNATITLWFRPQSLSQINYIISTADSGAGSCQTYQEGYNLWVFTNGNIALRYHNQTNGCPKSLNTPANTAVLGTWTHIALRFNDTGQAIFINGALTAERQALNGNIPDHYGLSTKSYTAIGNRGDVPSTLGCDCDIDEVYAFNRALNADEISNIYNNATARFYSRGEHHFSHLDIEQNSSFNTINITINNKTGISHDYFIQARIGLSNDTSYNDSIHDSNFVEDRNFIFHFDNETGYENQTHIMDWANGTDNGTVVSTNNRPFPNLTSGAINGSWEFDGDFDTVEIPTQDYDDLGTYTWTAWIYPHDATARSIWGMTTCDTGGNTENGYVVRMDGSGLLCLQEPNIVSCNTALTDTITANTWQFITITHNTDTDIKVYMNGKLDASYSSVGLRDENTNKMYIGNLSRSSAYSEGGCNDYLPYDGLIDEFQMWNRVLTQDEIQEVYVRGTLKFQYEDWINASYSNSTSSVYTFENWDTDKTYVVPEIAINTYDQNYTAVFYDGLQMEWYNVVYDTCTYSSGNWDIDCSDDCVLSSDTSVDNNAIISITGTGTFTVDGIKLTNFEELFVSGTDSDNICEVYVVNSGELKGNG